MKKRYLKIYTVVSTLLVLVLGSCGTNIQSLNHPKSAVSTVVAGNILKSRSKLNIKNKDVPALFNALHSENKLVHLAARKVILENPKESMAYLLTSLTNPEYEKKLHMKKYEQALYIFNDFPDSLEKVEFLCIVTRKIARYDQNTARSLLLKIDMMEERIPPDHESDLHKIEYYKKAIGLQWEQDTALEGLKDTLKAISDIKPESSRYNLFNHYSDALAEIYPHIDEEHWKYIENHYKKMQSLTYRTRGLVRLAGIHLKYDPEHAADLLDDIDTGYNGQQYYYLVDILPLFPIDYRLRLLKRAKKMALSVDDKEKRYQIYLELGLLGIDIDYHFARDIVSDLEEEEHLRAQLLGALALARNTDTPQLSRYLASLIIYDTNRIQFYDTPLAAKNITNLESKNTVQKLFPPDNTWAQAYFQLTLAQTDSAGYLEGYNTSLKLLKDKSVIDQEKFKSRFVQALSQHSPDAAKVLLDRSISHLLRLEETDQYPDLVKIWSEALDKSDRLSIRSAIDNIMKSSLKLTNEAVRSEIHQSLVKSLSLQDIEYIIPHMESFGPHETLKLLTRWLNEDITYRDLSVLPELFSRYQVPVQILDSLVSLPDYNRDVLLQALYRSNITNAGIPGIIYLTNTLTPYNFKEDMASYYSRIYDPQISRLALERLTNNRSQDLHGFYLTILSNQRESIPWKKMTDSLSRQIKKKDIPSGLKINLVVLNTLAGNTEALPEIRKYLAAASSPKDLRLQCISSIRSFQDKESADILGRLLKEDHFFSLCVDTLHTMESYDKLIKAYATSDRKDEIIEYLMVYRPGLMKKQLAYTGYIIPQAYHLFQVKGYSISYFETVSNAVSSKMDLIARGKYHQEFNETIEFSSSETEKELKGEYHLVTLDFLNAQGNIKWQVRATGYGSAWSENIVEGKEDPQILINKQAHKWVTREFKRKLNSQSSQIPFNF